MQQHETTTDGCHPQETKPQQTNYHPQKTKPRHADAIRKKVMLMKITEQNFVQELSKRNEEALSYVMLHYGGLVKSVTRRYLNVLSRYEEECISDVFFAVWTHIDSFQPERNPFANWIAGIARLNENTPDSFRNGVWNKPNHSFTRRRRVPLGHPTQVPEQVRNRIAERLPNRFSRRLPRSSPGKPRRCSHASNRETGNFF